MKFSLVLLSVVASALANSAHSNVKRDHYAHVANLQKKDATPEELEKRELVKRQSFSGQATYYDVTPNAGACGDWMQNSDYVVALNSPQLNAYGGYQNGKPTSCYKSITISALGQQHGAVIKDECPTCGWGSLDLSPSLFQSFTGLDAGVFPITWWFNDGSGGGGDTQTTTSQYTPPQQPTTTAYTPPPTTTTEYTPPPTTSTTPPPSTTSTTPPPSTTTTSSSENSIQDVPATTSTPPENIANVNKAAVKMAAFIHAAAGL